MRKMVRKLKFTLIELLVVVTIIAILMGILIPAVSMVREKAKITKAKQQMNALVLAIRQYETNYGYLPNFGALQGTSNADNYRALIEYLTCADGPDSGTTDSYNAKKIRFIDPPGNYGNTTTAVSGTNNTGSKVGDFLDPWGGLFQIYMDTNYDGVVNASDASGAVGSFSSLNGSVFIYSYGPNKTNDDGKNALFGEGKGKDDVCSWR